MKHKIHCWLVLVGLAGFGAQSIQARTFTDAGGRKVEATLVAVKEGKALLEFNGKRAIWPVENFSEEDQKYIADWLKNPPPVKVFIQAFEKQEKTTLAEGKFNSKMDADLHSYEIHVNNQSAWRSGDLTAKYNLFVVDTERKIRSKFGSKKIGKIDPKKRASFRTEQAEVRLIKQVTRITTSFTDGSSSVRDKVNRKKENFGGLWVRIYQGGTLVGESKKLSSVVSGSEPAWTEGG